MLSINSLSVTLGITFEMKGLFVNRLEVNCYDMQACALKDDLSLNRTIISYKTGVLLSKCERDRYNPHTLAITASYFDFRVKSYLQSYHSY